MPIATATEARRYKNEIWGDYSDAQFGGVPPRRIIVAEGDSWFDYPLNRDILDYLKHQHGYRIKKFSRYGDTIYSMAFGPQLGEVTDAIARYGAGIVLLSAGGNDIAGPELLRYLNAATATKLDDAFVRMMFGTIFKTAYLHIVERISYVDPNVHIFGHGYGHAIPNGKGFSVAGLGFVGPWLKPHLLARGITDRTEARQAITLLIDAFNTMLLEIDRQVPNFHYVDLRPHIIDRDWENELHLNDSAFAKVARVFDVAIRTHLDQGA